MADVAVASTFVFSCTWAVMSNVPVIAAAMAEDANADATARLLTIVYVSFIEGFLSCLDEFDGLIATLMPT